MIKYFSKIQRTKRRAKRLAISLDTQLDGMDCGAHVLGIIRPRFRQQQREFEELMEWLCENDPEWGKA